MFKKIILSSVIVLNSSTYALELHEALTLAYKNNPQLKSIQESYLREIEKFPQALSQGFLPSIEFGASIQKSKTTSTGVYGGGSFNSKQYQPQFVLSQNLFNGGGSVSQLAAAKYAVQAAKAAYLSQEQEFLNKAISAYLDTIQKRENLAAAKSLVTSSQHEHEAAEEKMQLGEATKIEVASTKALFAKALFNAAKSKAELETAKSNFMAYFGIEPQELNLPAIPNDLLGNFEQYKQLAQVCNLSLKQVNSQLNQSKNTLWQAKSHLLPTLNIQAAVTRTYNDNKHPGQPPQVINYIDDNLKSRTASMGGQSPQTSTRSYSTALTLNVPIFKEGGVEYSKVRQAKSDLRKAAYNIDQTKNDFLTSLIQSWENYQSAQQSIIFASEAVKAQELQYDGIKNSYEVGHNTILDVLRAEQDLYEARIQNSHAKNNALQSAYSIKAVLAKLTGKELDLKTKLFDPEQEFKKIKFKIIGF